MVQDGPQPPRARRPRRRLLLIAACAGAALATTAGIAAGAVGDLTYANCITGEEATGPAGTNACAAIATASPGGNQSGFNNPQSTAISPDGRSLYLASGNDASVARFDRDPATGALTYQGCIGAATETGPTGSNACTLVPNDQSFGVDSGFDNMRAVAVSANGASVYAVSGDDDAIVQFSRNTGTGALTYQGCFTGETESVTSGACAAVPGDTSNGSDSGLDFLTSVAVSPDGTSVYTGSDLDDAIARFSRDTGTGALTYLGCVTGEDETGPGGTDACTEIPDASTQGQESGLDNVLSLAVSPDGESVYAGAAGDDAVAGFDRVPATGTIIYQGCISGETESGPTGTGACAAIPAAASGGGESGFDELLSIAINSGGGSLYAVSHDDDALARFNRDPGTGLLTYQGCLTGETESGPSPGSGACTAIPGATSNGDESGVDELFALTVAPGGASVHAVSQGDDGVATFGRDTSTGAITYRGCVSGETQSGPAPGGSGACSVIPSHTSSGDQSGLDKPRSLAVSPDNSSLYATSPADDSVARFGREPEVAPVPPPPEPYKENCFGITIDGKTAQGGSGNDKLDGTAQSDQLRGAGGNDKISGKDAADCLFGNADKDKVSGQNGDDVIRGGSGNDKLSGGKDDDTVRAQDGDDNVKGGTGDDFIKAQGRGRDKINCGSGTDRVVGDIKDKIAKNCEKVKIVDPN